MDVFMYVCMKYVCISIYVYVYVYMYVCMYLCIIVYMCVHICRGSRKRCLQWCVMVCIRSYNIFLKSFCFFAPFFLNISYVNSDVFCCCSQMCCWLLNVNGWVFRFASWKALRIMDGFQNYLFVVLSPMKRRVLLFKQRCSASVPFSDSNIIKRDTYTFEQNHERPLYKCWSSTDIEHFLSAKPYRNCILVFNIRMFLNVNAVKGNPFDTHYSC